MNKNFYFKNIKNIYGFDSNEKYFNLKNHDLFVAGGKIAGIFKSGSESVNKFFNNEKYTEIDCSEKIITPSFVDPHTHAIFGGTREQEFFQRNQGIPYLEIARQGGGIAYSVKKTREASENELLVSLLKRISILSSFGATHIEIKSGYGLSFDEEIRLLRIIKKAKKLTNIQISATCLAAHDFPPEMKHDPILREKYIDTIIENIIPEVKKEHLADFFDIFSEEKVYNLEQTDKILKAAKKAGFKIKLHSDELSNIGATEYGCSIGAKSVDHLLKISESGLKALKNSATIPVLLPGTAFYLNEPYAPFEKFKTNGIDIALASDFNPGSNCTENLMFIYSLAAIKFKMSAEEILKASTITASKALDLDHEEGTGVIEKNYPANINLFNSPSLEYIYYHYGINHLDFSLIRGEKTYFRIND